MESSMHLQSCRELSGLKSWQINKTGFSTPCLLGRNLTRPWNEDHDSKSLFILSIKLNWQSSLQTSRFSRLSFSWLSIASLSCESHLSTFGLVFLFRFDVSLLFSFRHFLQLLFLFWSFLCLCIFELEEVLTINSQQPRLFAFVYFLFLLKTFFPVLLLWYSNFFQVIVFFQIHFMKRILLWSE